jgi:hypothetical protein
MVGLWLEQVLQVMIPLAHGRVSARSPPRRADTTSQRVQKRRFNALAGRRVLT